MAKKKEIKTDLGRRSLVKAIGIGVVIAAVGAGSLLVPEYFGAIDFERAERTGRWQDYFDSVLANQELVRELRLGPIDKIYWDPSRRSLTRVCDDGIRLGAEYERYYKQQLQIPETSAAVTFISPYKNMAITPRKQLRHLILIFKPMLNMQTEDDIKSYLEHEGDHADFENNLSFYNVGNITEAQLKTLEKQGTDNAYFHTYSEVRASRYQLDQIANGKRPNISRAVVRNALINYKKSYEKLLEYGKLDDLMGIFARNGISDFLPPELMKMRFKSYLK